MDAVIAEFSVSKANEQIKDQVFAEITEDCSQSNLSNKMGSVFPWELYNNKVNADEFVANGIEEAYFSKISGFYAGKINGSKDIQQTSSDLSGLSGKIQYNKSKIYRKKEALAKNAVSKESYQNFLQNVFKSNSLLKEQVSRLQSSEITLLSDISSIKFQLQLAKSGNFSFLGAETELAAQHQADIKDRIVEKLEQLLSKKLYKLDKIRRQISIFQGQIDKNNDKIELIECEFLNKISNNNKLSKEIEQLIQQTKDLISEKENKNSEINYLPFFAGNTKDDNKKDNKYKKSKVFEFLRENCDLA